ncbi:protein translocase subunit SecF [Granulosicoccaceae sp. 1_MG-2023]|nr:protein translocase subunit SecF [Granulosicoccaceae sp. 1_MG-2023]
MTQTKTPVARVDVMGFRKPAIVLSVVLVVLSIVLLAVRGLNFGVDFTGGYVIEVGYPEAQSLDPVRESLAAASFDDAVVQHFGTSRDVLIRLAPRDGLNTAALSEQVLEALGAADDNSIEMRRVEFVGPQVGEELREQGGLSVLVALLCIVVYIWLRFEKKFALGSVLALTHDVIITLGVFALIQAEFDLSVLAAILAVIGYSLNDTIVVFDRIRENFRKLRKVPEIDMMNISINETFSRTLITSFTTLLVLFALFFLGGEIIRSFSLALIIGIGVGTYSSIFVASAAALMLGVTRQDLMPVEKEGEELDDLP